jgi:hypothetical protein
MLEGRDFDVTEFAIPVVIPLARADAVLLPGRPEVEAIKPESWWLRRSSRLFRVTRNELLILCNKRWSVGGAWLRYKPVLFASQ